MGAFLSRLWRPTYPEKPPAGYTFSTARRINRNVIFAQCKTNLAHTWQINLGHWVIIIIIRRGFRRAFNFSTSIGVFWRRFSGIFLSAYVSSGVIFARWIIHVGWPFLRGVIFANGKFAQKVEARMAIFVKRVKYEFRKKCSPENLWKYFGFVAK